MLPIIKPLMDEREAQAARRAILSGWVTQGPEVAGFEREFAAYVGAPYACAVSSCTAALHLALLSVGVTPGDEVITVSHSFIATANSIRYCGALPVFVDIEPGTFNMDPALIERVVTSRTRAILCVHQVGMPCDLASILAVARRHRLAVVEDAACAAGSEVLWNGNWERIGKPHGDIACFSFHPRKLLSTGDGGMLTTASAEWDARFRLLRQHGMGIPDSVRHRANRVMFESYLELGYNYRLTDIQAAIGREQLMRLPLVVARRREQVDRYRALFGGIAGLILPEEPQWARTNWQSFCVRLPEHCGQAAVMQTLLDAGIATRRGIMCAHREPAYRGEVWSCGAGPGPCTCPPGTCRRLSQSERAQDTVVTLPLFHEMTSADQERVAAALREACA
jgi:dTDP-4-amino-4,6-dideoxygalactose transaminase